MGSGSSVHPSAGVSILTPIVETPVDHPQDELLGASTAEKELLIDTVTTIITRDDALEVAAFAKFQELVKKKEIAMLGREGIETMTDWVLECHLLKLVQPMDDDMGAAIRGQILDIFQQEPHKQLAFRVFFNLVEEVLIRLQLQRECARLFRLIDQQGGGGGALGRTDAMQLLDGLLDAYESHGCDDVKRELIRETFTRKFDSSGDDTITKSEFAILFEDVYSELNLLHRVKCKFNELDLNQNGSLEEFELLELADWVLETHRPHGAVITLDEKEEMKRKILRRCDLDKTGRISLASTSGLLYEVLEEKSLKEAAARKFTELDVDKSGFLAAEEIVAVAEWVVKTFRLLEPIEDVRQRIVARIGYREGENSDRMNEEEFSRLFIEVIQKIKLVDRARQKFTEFDVDGSGKIGRDEAGSLCEWVMHEYQSRREKENMSEEEKVQYREALIRIIDKDGDGMINLIEFAEYFEKMTAAVERKRRRSTMR